MIPSNENASYTRKQNKRIGIKEERIDVDFYSPVNTSRQQHSKDNEESRLHGGGPSGCIVKKSGILNAVDSEACGYNNRTPPKTCTAIVPMQLEVSVGVKTVCDMRSPQPPRHMYPTRGRGGTEVLAQDENAIDEKLENALAGEQPLHVLKEILKRQRNILAGLASEDHDKNKKRISGTIIKEHRVQAIDKDAADHKMRKYTRKECETLAKTSKKPNRHHHHGGNDKRYVQDVASHSKQTIYSRNGDLYDSDCSEDEATMRQRLKAGGMIDSTIGIPESLQREAILRGVEMCNPQVHRSKLIEIYNRRKMKNSINRRKLSITSSRMKAGMNFRHGQNSFESSNFDCQIDMTEIESLPSKEHNFTNGMHNRYSDVVRDCTSIKSENRIKSDKNMNHNGRLRGGMEKLCTKPEDFMKFRRSCNYCSNINKIKNSRSKLIDKIYKEKSRLILPDLKALEKEMSRIRAASYFNTPVKRDIPKRQESKAIFIKNIYEKPIPDQSNEEKSIKRNMQTKNKEKQIDRQTKQSLSVQQSKIFDIQNRFSSKREPIGEPNLLRQYHSKMPINRQESKWKMESTKITASKIMMKKCSKTCACCSRRKAKFLNKQLAEIGNIGQHASKQIITNFDVENEAIVNNLENSLEVDYYNNTVQKQRDLRANRTRLNPLETLQKVNEKLLELSALASKTSGTVPFRLCSHQKLSTTRIKRRKTRRYYESHAKHREYPKQLHSDDTESNFEQHPPLKKLKQ